MSTQGEPVYLRCNVVAEPLFNQWYAWSYLISPPPATRFEGAGVRIRYFGHACVLFESAQTSVLCDPVVSYPFAGGVQYTEQSRPIVESDRLVAECLRRGLNAERLYVRKEILLSPR